MTFDFLQRRAARLRRVASALVRATAAFVARKNRLRLAFTAWRVLRTQGLRGLKQEVLQFVDSSVSYERWIALHDTLADEDCAAIRTHVSVLASRPLISILVPTYNTQEKWLRRAIESVREQLYPHWELCIADDASTAAAVREVLEEYSRLDPRIRVVFRAVNGHICATSNTALGLATGDFVALLDHDDELSKHALYMVAFALNENPDLDLLYSDEDKIDEAGRRFWPYFKPDWNPALQSGQNVISHLGVYRTSLVRSLGGFREGYEGSQDWDLALRFGDVISAARIHHIPHVLYHWRALAGSTAVSADRKPYAMQAAEKALRDHLERTGFQGSISRTAGGYFRTHPQIPSPPPLVSIVVLSHDGVHALRRCIAGLRAKTGYPDYEILVVVGDRSDDPETLAYLDRISADGVTRVLQDHRRTNLAALTNVAVKAARGSCLCLMNSDIEVISADWLEEMVARAMQPGTGAVGAKLLCPDGVIQHAGLILGMEGVCGHIYSGAAANSTGYMKRLLLLQNMSAVTAACMVVRKEVYEQVGGFDENNLPVSYSDVDFCLRLLESGYQNLWTPYAELRHHESAARGFDETCERKMGLEREAAYMRARWGEMMECDPAHNPNLSLDNVWPALAVAPRVRKPWRAGTHHQSKSEVKQ